jgi:hypothetical protein
MRPTPSSAPQINDIAGSGNGLTAIGADGTIWRLNPL